MTFPFKTFVSLRPKFDRLDLIQLNKPSSIRDTLSLCLRVFCPDSVKIDKAEALAALYRREMVHSSIQDTSSAMPHGSVFSAGNTILTLIGKFPSPVNWLSSSYPASVSIVGIILFPPSPTAIGYIEAEVALIRFFRDVHDGKAKTDEQCIESIHKHFDRFSEVQIF